MTTKIVDKREPVKFVQIDTLKKGDKFDFNRNIMMVTGADSNLRIVAVDLVNGWDLLIPIDTMVEPIAVEIIVSKM